MTLNDDIRKLVAGGSASALAKTAFAPFERIKLVLQSQMISSAVAQRGQYRGVFDALSRLRAEQGLWSLWRGNVPNVARIVPTYALRFTLFDHLRDKLKASSPAGPGKMSWWRQCLAGSLSGGITCVVVYPLDIARTRLSLDLQEGGARTYSGIVDCLRKTMQREGLAGVYKGIGVSVVEIMPYTGITLGMYSALKGRYPVASPQGGETLQTKLLHFTFGWASGCCASLFCYPLDTVKRRMMLGGSEGFVASYAGVSSCMGDIWRNERGLRGFYRGCLVNVLKSAPVAGLTLVMNDSARQILGVSTS